MAVAGKSPADQVFDALRGICRTWNCEQMEKCEAIRKEVHGVEALFEKREVIILAVPGFGTCTYLERCPWIPPMQGDVSQSQYLSGRSDQSLVGGFSCRRKNVQS